MKAVIVDDESLSADYLESLCLDIRTVEVAGKFGNAYEALDYLKDHDVDLAFLDIEMPGLTGLEAVQEMRRLRPELTVVFVTGYEQYALEAFKADAVSYLLKPCDAQELERAVEKAMRLAAPPKKRVEIRTFGHFCLFVGGEPVRFSNHKAQELLALAVDRWGTVVTMEQAAGLLWEGRPYDETLKQLYRKAVIYLRHLFEEKGLDIFAAHRGSFYILPDKVDCDYYRLMNGDGEARRQFSGEYMIDYSWAEETTGKIERYIGNI